VATDPSERCVQILRRRYANSSRVEVHCADHSAAADSPCYDTIVLINVLEHIEDDLAAVKELVACLKPGGHVVIWVPGLPHLYSDFDRRIGHYRRYRIDDLTWMVQSAGADVLDAHYANAPGAVAWWILARHLGRNPTRKAAVRLYDRNLIPIIRRIESLGRPPFGQSIFCVGRRLAD
jgi:SAM-dependent methyltransferase